MRLFANGKARLVFSIPLYRCWWRLRGLDFGIVGLRELGLDPQRSNHHQNGGGPLLSDLLNGLGITSRHAALDLGSGKGGAMATMAQFRFRKVDGVEISEELAEVARKNLAKLNLKQCSVFHADATTFNELDEYSHIFMYNPFPDAVMKKVLDNIESSLRRAPRKIWLLYHNPLCEQAILASGSFSRASIYEPFPGYRICVYESSADISANGGIHVDSSQDAQVVG